MVIFFFNDPATTEIYPLSLHAALPISVFGVHDRLQGHLPRRLDGRRRLPRRVRQPDRRPAQLRRSHAPAESAEDRKSTRLNSSHANISYAVFCLKKKKTFTDIYYFTN